MSRFSGRKIILFLVMLSFCVILVACGASSNQTNIDDEEINSEETENKEPETVTVYAKEGLEEPFETIEKNFSEEHEDIVLDIQYLNNEDIETEVSNDDDNSIIFSTEDIINDMIDEDLISHQHTGVAMMDELVLFTQQGSNDVSKPADINKETRIGILNPELFDEGKLSKEVFEDDEFEQVDTDKNLVLGDTADDVKQDVINNNAQVGVLYLSNVQNDTDLTVMKRLPRSIVAPYIYQIGIVTQNNLDDSTETVYDYLLSNDSLDVFADYGYII